MHKIIVRRAEIEDIQNIKILMEKIFGPFAQIEALFKKWIHDEKFSIAVAILNSELVGICTWCVKENLDFQRYESFGAKTMSFVRGKRAGWILNLAVAPEHRKEGVAKSLAISHLKWLKEMNCDIVCGCSWVNGTDDNSLKFYLKAGFENLGESRDYMRTQMRAGAECAVCKTSDCTCNTIFFGISASNLIKVMEGI